MGILSKLTRTMRIRKIRREARQKAYEALCLSPLKYSRAIAEIDCIIVVTNGVVNLILKRK